MPRGEGTAEGYAPIASYGLIGNMRTAALVGVNGSIDWLCLPHFDSPSVFGAILDARIGGRFRVWAGDAAAVARQHYWPDTNVLMTHWNGMGVAADVLDFMPVGVPARDHETPDLIRLIRPVHGFIPTEIELRPAFDYARRGHRITGHRGGAMIESGDEALALSSTCELEVVDGALRGRAAPGRPAALALWYRTPQEGRAPGMLGVEQAEELLWHTIRFWRGWMSRCAYRGRWREVVRRSALALKLLTFERTGAIVAAPTSSLPELFGGSRNWDYRYTWLRDAAFTIYSLLRVGYSAEAAAFFRWLDARCHEREPGRMLQPLYTIHGGHDIPETVLGHLEGYRGSRPVRIGNAASRQLQLDAYGAVMDGVYLHNKHAMPTSYELWQNLREVADWVCEHWDQPDRGIWEVRGPPRHFVYSKLMCWVTLDRAMRLAIKRSFPADVGRWRAERDRMHDAIMTRGWSDERGAFVQDFSSRSLDAANLLMSQVLFLGPTDPRMLGTIRAVSRPPSHGGLLDDFIVYRYDYRDTDDGVCEPESGFNMCTFWLIEALTRAGRERPDLLEQARLLFERMLGCASPVGLYAEQSGLGGEAIGNYPQALTHLSLISAAMGLDRALGDG